MSYKTWRSIDITLDKASLTNAIKEIRDCQRQLTEAMNALIRELAEQGAQVAKMQVASMGAIDTGALESSIYGEFDPKERIGYIRAGEGLENGYAFYVEYGTGPVGEADQHPEPGKVGWAYNVGETIGPNPKHPEWGDGWWYPGDDGKKHWTSGQPSRPFMYNTFGWLETAAAALGRKILS